MCCCGGLGCACGKVACNLSMSTVQATPGICQTSKNSGGQQCLSSLLASVGTYGTALTASLSGRGVIVCAKTGKVTVAATSTPQLSSGVIFVVIAVLAVVVIIAMGQK